MLFRKGQVRYLVGDGKYFRFEDHGKATEEEKRKALEFHNFWSEILDEPVISNYKDLIRDLEKKKE